jgi:membrane dipeptidase
MSSIGPWIDHRRDPGAWARALGISREAIELYLACEPIDLHVDTFIWARIFGYDLLARHGRGPTGARLFGQVDLPRLREAQIAGAIWSITTNPLRRGPSRRETFVANLARLRETFARAPDQVAVVRDLPEYRAARAKGVHAAFVGIQGGNALDEPNALDRIPDRLVVRITLVHLSTSRLGVTSSPLAGRGNTGLTSLGRAYVERLDHGRIFVDLAHISRRGFFDAVEAHDPSLPLIVTHTGVTGVHPHWRNLEPAQIRAVADTGGTIGVMYQSSFLGAPARSVTAATIVDHLDHLVQVGGEGCASLGSDWDGMILPPRDLATCLELPRLVQIMLDRGWPHERVRGVLGGNYLRALGALRGE